MSSDTFTTAIFLITAIVAAAVLVNAFFPVIYQASGTFTKSSHAADQRLRTDIKIVNTFSGSSSDTAKIWIKNVGSARIGDTDLERGDIFIGTPSTFDLCTYESGSLGEREWQYSILDDDSNGYWDGGETVRIDVQSSDIPDATGNVVYFQFVLPTGTARSIEYTVS